MSVEIKKAFEGRCGNNLTPTFEVYVDSELCGFAKQKWLAKAIAESIVLGNIESTGDTTGRLADWAYKNDYPLFERIAKI